MMEKDWAEYARQAKYKTAGLAAVTGMGERRLRRVFHRTFGCAPALWMKRRRLEQAQALLRQGCQVKWVAYSLFYPDVPTFTHQFKAAFAMSPSEFAILSRRAVDLVKSNAELPLSVRLFWARWRGLAPTPSVSVSLSALCPNPR